VDEVLVERNQVTRSRGHEVELVPDRHRPDLMARVSLLDTPRRPPVDDELFAAILRRRTVRLAFDNKPVPRDFVIAFETKLAGDSVLVRNIHAEGERRSLCELVEEADRIQFADRRFRRELASWVHANRSRARDGMPSSALGAGDLANALAPTILRTFDTGKGRAASDRHLVEARVLTSSTSSSHCSSTAWVSRRSSIGSSRDRRRHERGA
jgi:hypothetical protein